MAASRDDYQSISSTDVELQNIGSDESPGNALLEDLPAHVQGWPTAPRNIKSGALSSMADLGVDMALVLLAISFLAFSLIVRNYDQIAVKDHPKATEALLDATRYGPTVFPILFACILGRASHSILVWRLEKGERIGILDILAGSTSLTNVVTTQLKLGLLSVLGLCLLAIWTLSPLGGQACLRQMSLGNSFSLEKASITYTMQNPRALADIETSGSSGRRAVVGTIFGASLLAPPEIKASPRDIWNNVKIPKVETYENSTTADPDGWHMVDDETVIYASLVGIPMAGIENADGIDYTVNIEAQYLHLECPKVGMRQYPLIGHEPTFANFTGPGARIFTWDNTTARMGADPRSLAPLNFTYLDWGATGSSQCLLMATYVEVEVFCTVSTRCAVTRIRRSRLEHPPSAYTLVDDITNDSSNWEYVARDFVRAMDSGQDSVATPVQGYLDNPDYPTLAQTTLDVNLTKEVYADRLGQLVNAYWECMVAKYAIPGGMNEKTAIMAGNSSDAESQILAHSAKSDGTRKFTYQVIEAHTAWIVVLGIASAVMILASFVSPVIRYFLARGPNVMLNISSLATRDSTYIALPTSGSFMDANQRARLVKNHRVRFGDIHADLDVGKLVIGTLDSQSVPSIEPVRRKRLYM